MMIKNLKSAIFRHHIAHMWLLIDCLRFLFRAQFKTANQKLQFFLAFKLSFSWFLFTRLFPRFFDRISTAFSWHEGYRCTFTLKQMREDSKSKLNNCKESLRTHKANCYNLLPFGPIFFPKEEGKIATHG